MATGDTFLAQVEAGLPTAVASARTTREFPTDVMARVIDRQTLAPHTGTAWREFLAAQLNAQNYGETDVIDAAQQLSGSIISFTPQLVAILTFIGKRVAERLDSKAYETFGNLAQQAIERKADEDSVAVFASATTTLAGTGQTLVGGVIAAAGTRISSNVNEPGPGPIACVLHGYQIADLYSEVTSGLGTYPMPEGYSTETWKSGFKGMINNVNIYEDGNIAINSTPDARGAVFSKMGIVKVQGMSPWTETENMPSKGYGGVNVYLKDEYVNGERSAGNWLYGILSDATVPTSL